MLDKLSISQYSQFGLKCTILCINKNEDRLKKTENPKEMPFIFCDHLFKMIWIYVLPIKYIRIIPLNDIFISFLKIKLYIEQRHLTLSLCIRCNIILYLVVHDVLWLLIRNPDVLHFLHLNEKTAMKKLDTVSIKKNKVILCNEITIR